LAAEVGHHGTDEDGSTAASPRRHVSQVGLAPIPLSLDWSGDELSGPHTAALARLLLGAQPRPHREGLGVDGAGRFRIERDLAAARSQLDEAVFATAWAAGQALTLEQAIAYALEGPDAATATARIGHQLGRAKPGLQDRHTC
jgi:hypothetical protein